MVSAASLSAFHAAHFNGQITPSISPSGEQQRQRVPDDDDDGPANSADGNDHVNGDDDDGDNDGLGYYADGVKRTLTDDQVRMFRHSEIQRLLTQRRLAPARQDNVQSLIYDDVPLDQTTTTQTPRQKEFLWPKLGQSR
ncbi:hypothetical protein DV738_g13, partial [Chaetothyriales sp. CBS 135597]